MLVVQRYVKVYEMVFVHEIVQNGAARSQTGGEQEKDTTLAGGGCVRSGGRAGVGPFLVFVLTQSPRRDTGQ